MLPLGIFALIFSLGFMGSVGAETVEDDDDISGDMPETDPTEDAGDGFLEDGSEDSSDDDGAAGDDGGGDAVDDPLPVGEVTLETDPETGALTATLPDGDTGSLALIEGQYEEFEGAPNPNFGFFKVYDAALFYVPDGFDLEAAYDTFDWEAFETEFEAANGNGPSFTDYFEALGLQTVAEFDEARWLSDTFGATLPSELDEQTDNEIDTRALLPDINSNADIAYFKVDSGVNGGHAFDWFEIREIETKDAFDHEFAVALDSDSGDGFDVLFNVADGDVVFGTDANDDIDSPPGDPTAVTILAGAGNDILRVGLNDTVVTNDDQDEDIIQVGEPESYAEVYEAAPVLRAGPEDIVQVDGDGNFVIRFEQDLGNGDTAVFYHVLTTDAALVSPASSLGDGDALSLKEFYALSGWQLLAVGSLGSVTSDGATTFDNTIPAPSFDGLDTTRFNLSDGLFSMELGADGAVTSETDLVTGWPALV